MTGVPLELNPRACDRCGRCLAACPANALTVGRTYLKVRWQLCDGCGACARACRAGAIVLKGASGRGQAGKRATAAGQRPVSGAAAAARPKPEPRHTAAKAGKAAAPFTWTLLEAVAMLSVTFAAFALKEALASSSALQAIPSTLGIPASVGLLAIYYALQIAVLVWLVRRRGGDLLAALRLRRKHGTLRHAFTSAALVVGGLLAVRFASTVYAYATRAVGKLPATSTDLPTLFGSDAMGFMLAVMMVVIIGPVVEEAVFRAALLEGLAARFGTWPGILVQAAIFAALHRSLWLLLPMFALGVVLGWLAHERESLWPPIALHSLYNAITVAAAFLVAGSA